MRITREPWDPFPITMPLERRIFSCCRYDLYDLSAMVPPVYKKSPRARRTPEDKLAISCISIISHGDKMSMTCLGNQVNDTRQVYATV